MNVDVDVFLLMAILGCDFEPDLVVYSRVDSL